MHVTETSPEAVALAPATTGVPSIGRWIGAIAVVGLAAAFGGWWMRGQDAGSLETWSQFTQLTDLAGAETGSALSPDGNSFACVKLCQ